jgi:hypothetical protein
MGDEREIGQVSGEDLRAAADALASKLGAAEPADARVAALERLSELRAAETISETDYLREKRRLLGQDRPA